MSDRGAVVSETIDTAVCVAGRRIVHDPRWRDACMAPVAARIDVEGEGGTPTLVMWFCMPHFDEFAVNVMASNPQVISLLWHDREYGGPHMRMSSRECP